MKTILIIILLCLSLPLQAEIRPRIPATKPMIPTKILSPVVDNNNGRRSLGVATLSGNGNQIIVTVKFIEGSRTRIHEDGTIYSLSGEDLREANRVIVQHSPASVKRMSYKSPEKVDSQRTARMERIKNRNGAEVLADLNTYFKVTLEGVRNAETFVDNMNALGVIEIAYVDYQPIQASVAVDIPPPTPSFDTTCRYLRSAPYGMGGDWAHQIPGGDGAGVQLIQVEGGWEMNNGTDSAHEDVPLDSATFYITVESEDFIICNESGGGSDGFHNDAIAGLIYAQPNGYGITGMAPGVTFRGVATQKSPSPTMDCAGLRQGFIEEAMEIAIDNSSPGDVITMSLLGGGTIPHPDSTAWLPMWIIGPDTCSVAACSVRAYEPDHMPPPQWTSLPTEWGPQAYYDLIASAWTEDVIWCEVAGNGYMNLDSSCYNNRFNREYYNTHAVMVGASVPPTMWVDPFTDSQYVANSKIYFSNYGDRVDLFAYGWGIAATSAYGVFRQQVGVDLATENYPMHIDGIPFEGDSADGWDVKQYYTNNMGGTSGATPLVACAIACYQGAYKAAHGGAVLSGDSIVKIFQNTGTPEQPDDSGHVWGIGVMPDLKAAFIATGLGPEGVEATNTAATGVTIAQ